MHVVSASAMPTPKPSNMESCVHDAVAVGVLQSPEMRNVRVVDVPSVHEQTEPVPSSASLYPSEKMTDESARPSHRYPQGVEPVFVAGEVLHAAIELVRSPAIRRQPIRIGLQGDVIEIPVRLGSRILDTAFLPLRLGDIDPTPAVGQNATGSISIGSVAQTRPRSPPQLHRIQWIDRFVGAEHDEQEEK